MTLEALAISSPHGKVRKRHSQPFLHSDSHLVLDQSATQKDNGRQIPTLYLDQQTRKFSLEHGRIVNCREGYTFPILAELAQHPNEPVGNQKIDDILTHSSGFGFPYVSQAIARVRKLLGDTEKEPKLVITVRSARGKIEGYMLRANIAPLSERPAIPELLSYNKPIESPRQIEATESSEMPFAISEIPDDIRDEVRELLEAAERLSDYYREPTLNELFEANGLNIHKYSDTEIISLTLLLAARRALYRGTKGTNDKISAISLQRVVAVIDQIDSDMIERLAPEIECIRKATSILDSMRGSRGLSRAKTITPPRTPPLKPTVLYRHQPRRTQAHNKPTELKIAERATPRNSSSREPLHEVVVSEDLILRPSLHQNASNSIMTVIGNGEIPMWVFDTYLLERRAKDPDTGEEVFEIILPYRNSLEEAEARGVHHHGVFPPSNGKEIPKPAKDFKKHESIYKHHGLQKTHA